MKKYFLIVELFIIALLLAAILFFLIVNHTNYDEFWFNKLQSMSTAVAAIGSITLLIATLIYVFTSRQMVEEMRKQRDIIGSPAVSLKIIPDKSNFNLLNMVLKNTGGGPAYDVSVNFSPDLPYSKSKTVNQLNVFNNLPLLDKGEEIEIFFASTIQYFESDSPKETTVTISYYKNQEHDRINEKATIIKYQLNIEERKGQRFVSYKDLNDLVTEVEELKQAILLLLTKDEEK